MTAGIQLSYEYVREVVIKKGYRLISTEYKNTKTPLEFICLKHQELGSQFVPFYALKKNHASCSICKLEYKQEIGLKNLKKVDTSKPNPNKKTIEAVRKVFVQRGYEPLFDTYKDNKEKLAYICPKHRDKGSQFISYNSISRKRGCRWCANEVRSIKCSASIKKYLKNNIVWNKYDIEYARDFFSNFNLILIAEEYLGVMEPMEAKCPNHPDKPNQFIRMNDLKKNDVRFGCRWCGIEAKSAENHPRWKGGITRDNHKARTSPEAIAFKKAVLKRDNYTCQCCGGNNYGDNRTELHVHHILGFSQYVELRNDVNNGITLCRDCHDISVPGSFHSVYGVYNNTLEQLEEYISNKQKDLNVNNKAL